jgi:hypothetical protein
MTQSIPSSFSSEDLQELLANARHEDDCQCGNCPTGDGPHGEQGLTDEQVADIAQKYLVAASTDCDDPVVHKMMLHMIINNMIAWHSRMGDKYVELCEPEQAMGWFRDAGKFQALANILDTISVSESDPTCDIQ